MANDSLTGAGSISSSEIDPADGDAGRACVRGCAIKSISDQTQPVYQKFDIRSAIGGGGGTGLSLSTGGGGGAGRSKSCLVSYPS